MTTHLRRIIACILGIIALGTSVSGCSPTVRYKPGEIPALAPPSPQAQQQAQQIHQLLTNETPLYTDPSSERRVRLVMDRLLAATPAAGNWQIFLLNSPVWNAMTIPGNYVYVYRGLLDGTQNNDELAAVLGHEIAHRLALHEAKSSGQQWGEILTMVAAIAAGTAASHNPNATSAEIESITQTVASLGAGATTLRYSKNKEREADQIGIFLMADAGFNPHAAPKVWLDQAKTSPQTGSDFFSTHPLHTERYANLSTLMPLAESRYRAALNNPRTPLNHGAISLNPIPPAAEQKLHEGLTAFDQADLGRAMAIANSLTTTYPHYPLGFNLTGLVHLRQGRVDDAETVFSRGLTKDPQSGLLSYNLACAKALKGDRAAALRYLEKAAAFDPALVVEAPKDSDLFSLHKDKRFAIIVTEAQRRAQIGIRMMPPGKSTFSVNGR